MDLKQFRANVEALVNNPKQPGDEEFHRIITGWMNEVSMAKLKAAVTEVGTQAKEGLGRLRDAIQRHHNK